MHPCGAGVFAVSRMLAMLVKMDLVPFSRLGIPGRRQHATLVYTIVFAMVLAALFDLSRIASLGAIFYLVMDLAIHWGVLRYLRTEVGANAVVVTIAIALDVILLAGFIWVKAISDPLVLAFAAIGIGAIFGIEWLYLRRSQANGNPDHD